MNATTKSNPSRRRFLQATGRVAAASTLAAPAVPRVHAGENNTIQLALIGCGGRGTGAAANALSVKNGPIQMVAMADIFDYKLKGSYQRLKKHFPNQVDVPEDRRFIGFDGYRKAMDCLKPGDVAIFATYPAFRWVHFGYAIQKGINVFMEKPVTVDGPTTRRMLKLAEESVKGNLKVGVGLMIRHCRGRQALHERIRQGEIGEIVMMRAYRMSGPISSFRSESKPEGISELLWQIQRSVSFLWASGGCFNDFYIHQIDECSWMKDAWPVRAKASGGRHFRDDWIDQNFDNYSVEYTYPDGTKLFFFGRCMTGCYTEFASYAHGTRGAAVITTARHTPGKVRTFKGHSMARDELVWAFPQPEQNPYQLEWDDLVDAIRRDRPYNEVKRGAQASLVASMGRMAAHTGQVITYDEMLNCQHEFAPDVDKLTMDSPAPLQAGPDGKYPIPQPGILGKREY
ncbi:MAG TPA: Gfo/Idh/MocA family oxidoreductase [Planctomycetes bacterium]|nr:Gfo/Idh/MocA family oxidoreductase [Planctomycetota bacterium]